MAGWAGFSEDELRKIQQKDQAVPVALGRGRKSAPTNRSRLQRERAMQLAAVQKTGGTTDSPVLLSPGQQLAKPPPPPPQPAVPAAAAAAAGGAGGGAGGAVASKPLVVEKMIQEPVNHVSSAKDDSAPVELEKQEVELREKTRIEQLQHEQKMMEERNRRKKALITKTIAEKSKQTQAEAVKLQRIKKELQTLDDMVSNDIGILRGRIEQASWDYSTARKRYEKAEAEYVVAKLDLHKKTEVKEQLTEHLCAIIQQNELRKANKLEELMQQLQVQTTEEEEEVVAAAAGSPKQDEQKNGKGAQTHGETLVCSSSPEQASTTEGQTSMQGVADSTIHQDRPPVTEPNGGDQDCKTLIDNSPSLERSESEASASAS